MRFTKRVKSALRHARRLAIRQGVLLKRFQIVKETVESNLGPEYFARDIRYAGSYCTVFFPYFNFEAEITIRGQSASDYTQFKFNPEAAAGNTSGNTSVSREENTMTDTTSTPVAEAPAKPAKKQPVAKGTKPAAPAKKKAAVKAAPAKAEKKGSASIRVRTFQLLAKTGGSTGKEIMSKLGLTGIPALLKDEGLRSTKPRIAREDREDVRGVVYILTEVGKQALKEGTVDSEAAPKSGGQEWPSSR